MKNTLYIKLSVLIISLVLSSALFAGEKKCNCNVEDIKKETAFLAKKLLELTKKDKYLLKQEKSTEIIIGFCTNVTSDGIILTCITPDLDPFRKNMLTGDVILRIDDFNFVTASNEKSDEVFLKMKANLRAGDVLEIDFSRDGAIKKVNVEVSEITQPGFTLEVYK